MSAHGLERRFGRVEAVAGVDLAIRRGEVYGFLGPNGAGKSTVVRILCTLLLPSAGRATVAGFDLIDDPQAVRLRIGAALQDASLDDRQTGLELLRVQARLYGLRGKAVRRRIDAVCELIDLDDAISRRIGTYSGGMKRRLDLATALIHEPEIVFLDEPTTGLDPASRLRVWEEVERLNRETGTTIFLTTQYLEEADRLADRVGIIDGGRIVGEGAPAELKRTVGRDLVVAQVAQPERAVAALSSLDQVESVATHGHEIAASVRNGPAAVTPIALALERASVQVEELSMRRPTLDDVFLEITGGRLQADEFTDEDQDGPGPQDGGDTAQMGTPYPVAPVAVSQSTPTGSRRRGRGWAALALWVVAMVVGIGIYTWIADPFGARDSEAADMPATDAADMPATTAPVAEEAEEADRTEAATAPSASATAELVVQGVAPSGSWVQIREGGEFAPILFEGTFTSEDSQAFPVTDPLWMRIGNTSGVELSLDQEPVAVSGGTANFVVTLDGVSPT